MSSNSKSISDKIWIGIGEKPLPSTTGTLTLDFSDGANFGGTLTGNITLANPLNKSIGDSGIIRIVNGTIPYTISYASYWKSAYGSMPALTSTANAVDLFGYYVMSDTQILIMALGDIK